MTKKTTKTTNGKTTKTKKAETATAIGTNRPVGIAYPTK